MIMSRTPYGFQKLLWHMTRIGMVQPSRTKTCTSSGYRKDGRWGMGRTDGGLKRGDIVGQEMWHTRNGKRVYDHTEVYEIVEIRQDKVKWKRVE